MIEFYLELTAEIVGKYLTELVYNSIYLKNYIDITELNFKIEGEIPGLSETLKIIYSG